MPDYKLAGININVQDPIDQLKPFNSHADRKVDCNHILPCIEFDSIDNPIRSSIGWVGDADRLVEVHDIPEGTILKVEGGSSCFIYSSGISIINVSKHDPPTQLDQDLISGPALVLVLALQEVWCLHAAAVMLGQTTFAFLGESGLGKSTLAGYLARQAGWKLVADDILPVTHSPQSVLTWPRFPQLKLPPDDQPGLNLPEFLPLNKIIFLEPTGKNSDPSLEPMDVNAGVKVLLSNTAGSRLFSPVVLSTHLDFCTSAAPMLAAYRLKYPHRSESLPIIRDLLERSC